MAPPAAVYSPTFFRQVQVPPDVGHLRAAGYATVHIGLQFALAPGTRFCPRTAELRSKMLSASSLPRSSALMTLLSMLSTVPVLPTHPRRCLAQHHTAAIRCEVGRIGVGVAVMLTVPEVACTCASFCSVMFLPCSSTTEALKG